MFFNFYYAVLKAQWCSMEEDEKAHKKAHIISDLIPRPWIYAIIDFLFTSLLHTQVISLFCINVFFKKILIFSCSVFFSFICWKAEPKIDMSTEPLRAIAEEERTKRWLFGSHNLYEVQASRGPRHWNYD